MIAARGAASAYCRRRRAGAMAAAIAAVVGLAGLAAPSPAVRATPASPSCCDPYAIEIHTNAVTPGPSMQPEQIAWRAPAGASVPMFFTIVYRSDDQGATRQADGWIDVFGDVHRLNAWPAGDPACPLCNDGAGGSQLVRHDAFVSTMHNASALECQTGPPAVAPCFADVDHVLLICPRLRPTVSWGGIDTWRFDSFSYWFEGDGSSLGPDASVDGFLDQVDLPCSAGPDAFHLAFGESTKRVHSVGEWGQRTCADLPSRVSSCANIMFAPN